MNLNGKHILLGVTGGIAAYKACELLRLLQREGAEVRVAMTPSAQKFVQPLTFASLSKCPVYVENGAVEARPYQHIDFPRWADLYIVAPCSANSIGRMANGIADEPVSLCFMACAGEKWIAPAMNCTMFDSPAVQKNLKTLEGFGVHILQSPAGELACGEVGKGRMLEPQEIVDALKASAEAKPKNGKNVLITVGRTEEPIDPVRYITNCSSGKTGVALAQEFLNAGFDVTLVAGPMEAVPPAGVQTVRVRSAVQMHDTVLSLSKNFDALVHCAAVADYRPANPADEKIKDSRSQLTIELTPNPNILRDSVAARNEGKTRQGQVIVGFALETADVEHHADEKLQKSGADLLVLNTPVMKAGDTREGGFGKDSVAFSLVKKGDHAVKPVFGAKRDLALGVVNFVAEKLGV